MFFHTVYEVDIRLGITFHYLVDAEKGKVVLQITRPYNISADIHILQVLVQFEMVAAEIE